jgi:hypothetical protein
MKMLTILLAGWFSFHAVAASLEEIAPHFAINAEIVWRVPTNDLPKRLWIYKKVPHVFSAATISNAVVLAGFQQKGFPKPSTNTTVLWDEVAGSTIGEPRPPSFLIIPDDGMIQYDLGDRWPNSPQDIVSDQSEVEYAWNCLAWLGVDRNQFVKTNVASNGVSFPRHIDGIRFPDETEGFSIQRYGKERKLRFFLLALPNLQRTTNSPTASPQEIIACIRASKTPIMPNGEEADYFARVKSVAKAKKLTITKLTPYYGEGVYGEEPTNNLRPKWVMPVAYLETTASFGTSNAAVRLYSPILSSDAQRLLGNKRAPVQNSKRHT